MPSPAFLEPKEATYTEWHNPLDVPQHVDIHEDAGLPPTRYTWKPGETRALPSRYDFAIQRLDPTGEMIVGGLAPRLVKVGSTFKLLPALDPDIAAREQAKADALVAEAQKQAAENALILAQAKATQAAPAADKDKKK